jgi:hypothetical protein
VSVRGAYHEAGHVLVSRSLGRPVESVSAAPQGSGGVTRGVPLPPDATADEIEQALVVVFAGEAAEEYADRAAAPASNGNDHDPWFTVGELEALADVGESAGTPSDRAAVDHYRELIGEERVERARALAAELVWRLATVGQLSKLAAELSTRNRLTSDEIEQILQGGES